MIVIYPSAYMPVGFYFKKPATDAESSSSMTGFLYSYCSVFGSVVSVPASPPVLSWSGGSVAAGSGSAVTGASVIVGASVTAAGAFVA